MEKGIVLKKSEDQCVIQVDGVNRIYKYSGKVKEAYVKTGSCEFDGNWDKEKEIGELTFIKSADFVKGDNIKDSKQSPSKTDGNWQDDMVNFETLLSDAHNKFKEKLDIQTKMLQVDFDKKTCVFKARVKIMTEDKEYFQVFEAHGDSTNDNISGTMIKPHFIRMAETRAIARALRWATNNATCAEEEK